MNKNKNLKFVYNVCGFAVIVFMAIREICGALLTKLPFEEGSAAVVLIGIVVFVAACLVPVSAMENALGMHPKLFKNFDRKNAAAAVAYGYLLILCASFANSLLLTVLRRAGLEFAPREITVPDSFFATVLYFVYICILPPLLEEIFTRGYILNAFKGFGHTFAVAVSAIVFGLLHSSLENLPLYLCSGIILARVYLAFDSIFPAILLHCANNCVSFMIISLQQRANAQSVLVLTVFVYTCAIAFGIWGKKQLDSNGVNIFGPFAPDRELFRKLFFCRRAYMAVAAFALMLFFAALGSYAALIK